MYAVSLRVDIVEFLCFGRKEARKYEQDIKDCTFYLHFFYLIFYHSIFYIIISIILIWYFFIIIQYSDLNECKVKEKNKISKFSFLLFMAKVPV